MSSERISNAQSPREYHFRNAALFEIVDHVNGTLTRLQEKRSSSVYDFYASVAAAYPNHVDYRTNQLLIRHLKEGDKQAEMAFTSVNMKSIIAGVSHFVAEAESDKDDLIQEGIARVIARARTVDAEKINDFATDIGNFAFLGGCSFIAQREGVPYHIVRKRLFPQIRTKADAFLAEHPYGLSPKERAVYADDFASQAGHSDESLVQYIQNRNQALPVEVFRIHNRPPKRGIVVNSAFVEPDISDAIVARQDLLDALRTIPDREAIAVVLYEEGLSMDQIGAELHVSKQRAHKLKDKGANRLRKKLHEQQ